MQKQRRVAETKKPQCRNTEASGNDVVIQENNVMSKSITNVVPFKFEAHEVRTLLIDDQPWLYAVDVCASLGLADTNKALIGLDDDEKCEHEQYSGSGRKPILINESGLYSLILRSRKAEAKRFKKWVTAEVLPAIRMHGRYEDGDNRMSALVADVIGVSGVNLLNGVISQKVSVFPTAVRRQARHKLHAILRVRFNVPRTELIPAEKLDAACLYVASYVLEGEFIARDEQNHGTFQAPIPASMAHRLLVSLDQNGNPRTSEVPIGACVMTVPEFISTLQDADSLGLTLEEQFSLIALGMQLLKFQSQRVGMRARA